MDFGVFSLQVPVTWTKLNSEEIDSYSGRIAIDLKDTLSFDLGLYSNNLSEIQVVILDGKTVIDPDKFRKTNISWDTVDGHISKIVYPVRSGLGVTGIYIDSLSTNSSGTVKFNLYGVDLKPINERLFLQSLKTLKFHNLKYHSSQQAVWHNGGGRQCQWSDGILLNISPSWTFASTWT
jgi:hypothetical protein